MAFYTHGTQSNPVLETCVNIFLSMVAHMFYQLNICILYCLILVSMILRIYQKEIFLLLVVVWLWQQDSLYYIYIYKLVMVGGDVDVWFIVGKWNRRREILRPRRY